MSKFEITGVNMPQLSFGTKFPGTHGTDYITPSKTDIRKWRDFGMSHVHLAVQWERLVSQPGRALEWSYMERMYDATESCKQLGVQSIVGIRSFAEFKYPSGRTAKLGDVDCSVVDYVRTIRTLCTDMPATVGLDIMNEPRPPVTTELWAQAALLASDASTATQTSRKLFVCGNGYSGAASWMPSNIIDGNTNWYGTANSVGMLKVSRLPNVTMNIHCYLDADGSGEYKTPAKAGSGAQVLKPVTEWARAMGVRLLLGEFGVPNNAAAIAEADAMLGYMYDNLDVWRGWLWWAAGPWWGNYQLAIETPGDPRLAMLRRWL